MRTSEPHGRESASELVAAMAHDVKHLGEQYLELVKLELAQGIATVKKDLVRASIGVGVAAVGAVFLLLALTYFATDVLGAPRWIAYGAVALAAIGAGAAVLLVRPKRDNDHALHAPQRKDPAS